MPDEGFQTTTAPIHVVHAPSARRNLVLADFFEHVLHLPLSYHAGTHSGRQLKIMLTGTDTLWWLWVSFFREHFSAFVFIAVLLPAAILLNWRLAMPLLALAVVFTAVTVLVMHKAERMQRAVERHYSDLAETAADALGNVSRWCRASPASSARCRRSRAW